MSPVRFIALQVLGLALVLAAAAHATPVPVVVPYYGATYGTPGGFSASDAKRVVELLESIDRRLEAIEQRQAGPVPLKKSPEVYAVAKSHCAACHTQATAEKSGGGFVLFERDEKSLRLLGAREKTRIVEAVQAGTMPPDGRKKLTPAERSAFKW